MLESTVVDHPCIYNLIIKLLTSHFSRSPVMPNFPTFAPLFLVNKSKLWLIKNIKI